VDRSCEEIQTALTEAAGDIEALGGADRQHTNDCAECARVATEELELHAALASTMLPEDHELQQQIVAAVHARRVRRHLWTVVPIAASFLVAAVGVLMIGGLPGSGLLSLLPLWSGQGWMALSDAVRDWSLVLVTTARLAGDLIPPLVQIAAALLALAGFWTSASALSRARETVRWRTSAR